LLISGARRSVLSSTSHRRHEYQSRYRHLGAAAPPCRAHVKKVTSTTEVSRPHSPSSPPNISAIGTPPWPHSATPPHGHSTMSELPHSRTRARG
jgi:hypothetical protein